MTDNLSLLSPDVREALSEMDDYMDSVLGEYPEGSAAWTALRAELLRLASAEAELAKLRARIANSCRADGQRVFDLLCLPVEFDGTLALVRLEDGE